MLSSTWLSARSTFLLALCVTAFGCSDGTEPADPDSGAPMETDAAVETDSGTPAMFSREVTHSVTCIDQSISQLMLFDTVNAGAITDESTAGTGFFETHIDATGGGLNASESYVYARFTETGLEKVSVSDEDAFDSADWDIGVRRYVIRTNSGVAGPSNTTAARTAPGTTFEGLTSVPTGLMYRDEAYFTESCDYVPDGSGIGGPATATASFWSYAGCVAMTGNVYVIQVAGSRHVKLEVLSYYTPENQMMCQTSSMTGQPSGAGNIRIRWAWLD